MTHRNDHRPDRDRANPPRLMRRPSESTRHFIRHYVEMAAVMFAGMGVLGLPAGWALRAAGTSWSALTDTAPAAMLLLMATTMTVPMVGWMRYRGHGRRANTEMAASMLVPTFAAMALTSVVADTGAILVGEHVVMLLGMLGVMLARPAEYTHHHGQHPAAGQAELATA